VFLGGSCGNTGELTGVIVHEWCVLKSFLRPHYFSVSHAIQSFTGDMGWMIMMSCLILHPHLVRASLTFTLLFEWETVVLGEDSTFLDQGVQVRHVPDCYVSEEPELKLLDVFL
jgi:hypothetical protein